jgi:hypothetical protein
VKNSKSEQLLMANSESKTGLEKRQSRRTVKTEAAECAPLVSAKRGKFESLKDAKIEALIYERLMSYKTFVKEIEGEEPEEGAIISAGLEMLLDADAGFARWLAEQRRQRNQSTIEKQIASGAVAETRRAQPQQSAPHESRN